MRNQKNPVEGGRARGRASLVAAATILLSLAGGPAAHADDGGLLDDAVGVVDETVEQVVEPVTQTVESAAPQPVQEVVEPVQEAVEPVQEVVEQATEPVRHVDEPAAPPPASEPRKDPSAAAAQVPAQVPAPTTAGGGTSHPGSAPATDRPADAGAAPSTAGHDRSRVGAAGRPGLGDLAPRAADLPRTFLHDRETAIPTVDDDVRSLTNTLMHMWAGDAPGTVDAGLAGREATGVRALDATSGLVPLVLGLLLGMLALVLARRHAQAPVAPGPSA